MNRVLDAIEKAAFNYLKKEGRPAVIIIDGVNSVGKHQPQTLEKLQVDIWLSMSLCPFVYLFENINLKH